MRAQGFTLIELMVVLAVSIILLTVAIPTFSTVIEQHAVRDARDRLVRSIRFTRLSAVDQGEPVSICAAADGTCSGNGRWEAGWMVFADPNGDGDCEDANGDGICDGDSGLILRRSAMFRGFHGTMRGNYFVRDHIRFDPRGFSYLSNGTISVCPDNDALSPIGLILSNPGRVRVTADTALLSCP